MPIEDPQQAEQPTAQSVQPRRENPTLQELDKRLEDLKKGDPDKIAESELDEISRQLDRILKQMYPDEPPAPSGELPLWAKRLRKFDLDNSTGFSSQELRRLDPEDLASVIGYSTDCASNRRNRLGTPLVPVSVSIDILLKAGDTAIADFLGHGKIHTEVYKEIVSFLAKEHPERLVEAIQLADWKATREQKEKLLGLYNPVRQVLEDLSPSAAKPVIEELLKRDRTLGLFVLADFGHLSYMPGFTRESELIGAGFKKADIEDARKQNDLESEERRKKTQSTIENFLDLLMEEQRKPPSKGVKPGNII